MGITSNSILAISSFSMGDEFIVEFVNRSREYVRYDNQRRQDAIRRFIRMANFKRVMRLGGYERFERPQPLRG